MLPPVSSRFRVTLTQDTYRNLPNKTLRMLQLALSRWMRAWWPCALQCRQPTRRHLRAPNVLRTYVLHCFRAARSLLATPSPLGAEPDAALLPLPPSSPRQYTHIAKVDDDVYLRPYNLLYDVVLGANRPSRKGLGGAAAGTGSSGGEEDSGLALPPAAVHEENGGQGGGSSGGQAGVDASRQQAGYRAAGGGGGGGDGSSRNGELGSQGLFIGGASGWFSHATDGFQPVRDPLSK